MGSESRLLDCRYNTLHSCTHNEDVGVRCQGCVTGDLRLVGGMQTYEGRVEYCQNNTWGTICDNSWGSSDANVACRQLGYSGFGAIARQAAFFGQGVGTIFLTDLDCAGTENSLMDCRYSMSNTCTHSEDAGVTCNAMRK